MLTGKELGAAIEAARIAKGVSKKKLAEVFDVTPPSVQGWVTTGRIDKSRMLELVAYFADVVPMSHWGITHGLLDTISQSRLTNSARIEMLKSRDYNTLSNAERRELLTLEIDPIGPPQTQPRIEANAEIIGMLSAWDNTTPLHDDEVAIPLYKEVEMAAGSGATEVVEVPGRLLRFAKSTLREAGVLEQNAACATIYGRSMERLIMDGATIGIDRGTTHIIDGEIYAFDHDGMLRVKYLYRLPGGGLRIRSENDEEYPEEILSAEQAAHIRILGWVFWWSTVRRRRGLSLAR